MGFYSRSPGSPLTLHVSFSFSIYGGIIRRLITHNQGLWSAHVYVFYVGEITPPQELSCACLQLARFSSYSLSRDLFSPALSVAEEVPSSAPLLFILSPWSDIVTGSDAVANTFFLKIIIIAKWWSSDKQNPQKIVNSILKTIIKGVDGFSPR